MNKEQTTLRAYDVRQRMACPDEWAVHVWPRMGTKSTNFAVTYEFALVKHDIILIEEFSTPKMFRASIKTGLRDIMRDVGGSAKDVVLVPSRCQAAMRRPQDAVNAVLNGLASHIKDSARALHNMISVHSGNRIKDEITAMVETLGKN